METTGRRGRRGPRQDAEAAAVSVALGERVRQRRGLLGMSQQELGKKLGLTFQQIQKYERGTNRIAVPTLLRLAAALDTTPDALLEGLDRSAGSGQAAEILDRESLSLIAATRMMPEPVRQAMLALAKSIGHGPPQVAQSAEPVPAPALSAPPAPAASKPAAARKTGPSRVVEKTAAGRERRRRGAVWDPSDIVKASRNG